MIFDYVEIAKPLDSKDKINLNHLVKKAHYNKSEITTYSLAGNHKEIEIRVDARLGEVRLIGSLPFWYAGHNFASSNEDFQNAIVSISEKVNFNFLNGQIKKFECGVVMDSICNPIEVIQSHISIKGMKVQTYDKGKYFTDHVLNTKLYDTGHRIRKICSKEVKKVLLEQYGMKLKGHYIRFENHYKRPDIHFKQREIIASNLTKDSMINMLKEDLYLSYQSIMKSHHIEIPEKASAGELATCMIIELCHKKGIDPMAYIRQFLRMHPVKEVLNKNDIGNRRRTFNSWMKNVPDTEKSKFDLSELLIDKLNESD